MAHPRFTSLDPEIFGASHWAEDRILDKDGTLAIFLEDEAGAKLEISFNAYMAFRKMDEGDALMTLNDIHESAGLGTRLYLVEDSEYLRWFHFESDGIRKGQNLTHYCLATLDSIIDVIAFDPPLVSA